jgi:uncharacterized protein (DUF2062 family)
MFAPFTGALLKLSFIETFLICAIGGSVSAAVFFYSSEYFIVRSIANKRKRQQEALAQGLVWLEKPKFTKTNKLIVKMKRTFGIYGICFWAPFFLSVPIGTIVTAKFYGKLKKSFPLIVFGMFLNSLIMSSFAYLF